MLSSHLLIWFDLVWIHINLHGLFNAKAIFVLEQQWYYLTHRWEGNGVHAFLLVISLKENIIVWLEFELAYFEATVQHFCHYSTGTPYFL